MPEEKPFEVGEELICTQYVERRDKRASLNVGDLVKVTHAFSFTYNGEPCQDIVVQRGRNLPIACLVEPGRFKRLTSNPTNA